MMSKTQALLLTLSMLAAACAANGGDGGDAYDAQPWAEDIQQDVSLEDLSDATVLVPEVLADLPPVEEVEVAVPASECASDGDCLLLGFGAGECEFVSCNLASGLCEVQEKDDGALCDDGNGCTPEDQCFDGNCTGGASVCACAADADCAPYDDDDLCNGSLVCEGDGPDSSCVVDPESVVQCSGDPGNVCGTLKCEPATGKCKVVPAGGGGACDDNNACSVGDHCEGLVCVSSGALKCDDADPCTKDECDPADGCHHVFMESCADCVGFQCLPCTYGKACAPEPHVGEGCCGQGDALLHLSKGKGEEAVDIESDGEYVWVCGGFGARISDISNPAQPVLKGAVTPRCQRIGLGEVLADGSRVFYLAHHGDSFIKEPHLWTYHLTEAGKLQLKSTLVDDDVLFEGMAWASGWLYVAAHGSGVKVYSTDAQGVPSLKGTVSGFKNAWKVDVEDGYLYVADASGGVKVLSLQQPDAPKHVAAIVTHGAARDLEAYGDTLYVALGGDGMDVVDISDPTAPSAPVQLETYGSVQAVSRDGDLVGMANWSHVELRSADSLHLLATEHIRHFPGFEQSLGVVVKGSEVLVAEWEGLHVLRHFPSLVAPDIFVQDDLLAFTTQEPNARALIIRNLGLLDLEVSGAKIDGPGDFELDKTALTIGPGEAGVLEIVFYPEGGPGTVDVNALLTLVTNDVDPGESLYELPLVAKSSGTKIDVGDSLTPNFGFLDPNGLNDVNGLKGHVVVLSYFALY